MGVPAQVSYEAQVFTPGLKGIYAYVRRPDKTLDGPFMFEEGLFFANGQYFFDYLTKPTDPEGRYIVMIFSPQENDRRSSVPLEFCARPVDLIDLTVAQPTEITINTAEATTIELDVGTGSDVALSSGDTAEIELGEDPDVTVTDTPATSTLTVSPDDESLTIETSSE